MRLPRALCLSLFVLICSATACFAQRDGVPAGVCQDLANVPTAICFGGESQKSDIELKAFILKIEETLEADDKMKLDKAEASWENYRDLNCDIESRVYFDHGSGENTEAETCLYAETRLHVKDLHEIYDWEMRPDR